MREEDKLLQGLVYCPTVPELMRLKARAHRLNLEYNRCLDEETEARQRILRELIGEMGEDGYIQGPLYMQYGSHTRIGKGFFANFNLNIQDDGRVTIGDYCDFGPNVTIVTALHPMLSGERLALPDDEGRLRRMCYAKPVRIGNACWLGSNVTVGPGVTIGNNCVIGAGSLVLRDIPDGSFAAGSPCRVIRAIGDGDSLRHREEVLGPALRTYFAQRQRPEE